MKARAPLSAAVFAAFAAPSAAQAHPANDPDLWALDASYVYQSNLFDSDGLRYRATGAYWPHADNTVELVRIRPSDMVSETFAIEVVSGVNANAVPGLDGNGPNQDFALYVYNATNP